MIITKSNMRQSKPRFKINEKILKLINDSSVVPGILTYEDIQHIAIIYHNKVYYKDPQTGEINPYFTTYFLHRWRTIKQKFTQTNTYDK